jgi:hypothetical protein
LEWLCRVHDVRVKLGGVAVVVRGLVKHCRAHLGAVDGEWTQFVAVYG